mmetsp:Transcript_6458/g.15952  ORF Transcript_6458/g.15952 Transcript_6458/m.15952 type:complete len:334 (-) Transcript_6458:437-1438(-)
MHRYVGEEYLLHPERAAGVCTHERRTHGAALLAVEVLAKLHFLLLLGLEVLSENLLDLWHAPRAADEFHLRDVCGGEVCHGEGFFDGHGETGEHLGTHLFELCAVNRRLEVHVLEQRLDDKGRVLVGTEDGLGLLGLRKQLPQGARVFDNAVCKARVLLLEPFEHHLRNLEVHEVPANVIVDRRAHDRDHRRSLAGDHARLLALELRDGDLGLARSHVVEHHHLRRTLFRLKVDGALDRKGRTLVHKSQNSTTSDLARRGDGLALPQVCVGRDCDHEVADALAICRFFGHALGELDDVRENLLRVRRVLCRELESGHATVLVVTQVVRVELVA